MINNTSKLSNLAREIALMGFQEESNGILALAEDQQLNLFEEADPPERVVEEYENRYDLSHIDFEEFAIPQRQIERRKNLIKILLREETSRSKSDIIDEVMKLPTDEYSLEHQMRNYRDKYPELIARVPEYISPQQIRMPGVEPAIRFLPDPVETEETKSKARRHKEEYAQKVKEFREGLSREDVEESIRERRLSYYKDRPITDIDIVNETQRLIDAKFKRPVDPEKYKININISQEEYARLEGKIRSAYNSVKTKVDALNQIMSEAEENMPDEPPAVNPEPFIKLSQYIEDLKYRVYFLSYKVLSDSAKYTIFGASTGGREWSHSMHSDLSFFSKPEEEWLEDPETLKNVMEMYPQADYIGSYYRGVTTPRSWAKNKIDALKRYEESIDRATSSYKRGIRFLKRLKRDLTKEIRNRLESTYYNSEEILYIERNHKDDLDIVYQEIINSLEKDTPEASRYNHYGDKGLFIRSYTPHGEDRHSHALNMFDINLLFHNKIKMYEVINNFASLILLLINKTSKSVKEKIINPAIERASSDLREDLLGKILGTSYAQKRLEREADPAFDTDFNDFYITPQETDEALEAWLSFSQGDFSHEVSAGVSITKNYNVKSFFVYPRFIIKDEKLRSRIVNNFKKQMIFKLLQDFTRRGDLPLRIKATIEDLLNKSEITIRGDSQDEIYQGLLDDKDKILSSARGSVLTRHFRGRATRVSSNFKRGDWTRFSDESGISEEYKELISMITESYMFVQRPASSASSEAAFHREAEAASKRNVVDMVSFFNGGGFEASRFSRDNDQVFEKISDTLRRGLKEYIRKYHSFQENNRYYLEKAGHAFVDVDFYGMTTSRPMAAEVLNNFDFLLKTHPPFPIVSSVITTSRLPAEPKLLHSEAKTIERLNIFREHLSSAFMLAIEQLKAITYARIYSDIFSNRMSVFGSVGPRAISRSYRKLNKRLRAKEVPLSKLVRSWEKEMVDKVDQSVMDFLTLGWEDFSSGRFTRFSSGRFTRTGSTFDQASEFYQKSLNGPESMFAPHAAAIMIAKRANVTNINELKRILKACLDEFGIEERYEGNFGHSEFKRFVPIIFKDLNNLQKKISDLYRLSEYAHNRGAGLPNSFFTRLIRDPNFKDLGRSGPNTPVNKYFDMCARLSRLGSLAKIRRDYGDVIPALLGSGMISRGLYTRVGKAYRLCREGVRVRPNLEGLEGHEVIEQMTIRELVAQTDTDLTALEDYAALEEYNKRVIQKDNNLFRLNWEVKSKNFRFRVLKTYDPRHFKVGVETSCCQRLGGLGENAAIDSYINPLAGVVILEFFEEGSGWSLASQSYFHFVPGDNGYILDNVESNYRAKSKVASVTGYLPEQLYAMLAKRIKDTYDVKYFLSGVGYSDISTSEFSRRRLGHDPRDFAWEKYTDWKPSSSLDLLNPKFDLPEIPAEKKRRRKLSELYRKIILIKYSDNNDYHHYIRERRMKGSHAS